MRFGFGNSSCYSKYSFTHHQSPEEPPPPESPPPNPLPLSEEEGLEEPELQLLLPLSEEELEDE